MAADKQTKLLAKQLFKMSVVDGTVSSDRVAGVLGWVEKHAPRHPVALLRLYHRHIVTELAKSNAVVEHAGPVADSALRTIESALTQKYRRSVAATARANPKLLAGLRVRVGCDVYESSISAQLTALSTSV
jgi:F-type H+-transporting ATPase subunit delta